MSNKLMENYHFNLSKWNCWKVLHIFVEKYCKFILKNNAHFLKILNFCWRILQIYIENIAHFLKILHISFEILQISSKNYWKFLSKNTAHFCWKILHIFVECKFLLKITAHFCWNVLHTSTEKYCSFSVEKCGRFLLGSIEILLLKVSCNDKTTVTVQATAFLLTKTVYVKKSKTYIYRDMWCINKVCLFYEKIH